jgi:hypothetical protein
MIKGMKVLASALSLAGCLLLTSLWVRSYWYFETASVSFGGARGHWLGSIGGEIRYARPLNWSRSPHGVRWSTYDENVQERLQSEKPHSSFLGFWWARSSRGQHFPVIPYWFVVGVFAALATAPWLRWRYGLRTLLLVMTVVAAICGLAPAQ